MASKGAAFLLKMGDGLSPQTYATVAGLRIAEFAINQEPINSGIDVAGFRGYMSNAREVTFESDGIFVGRTFETQMIHRALMGALNGYELSFETGVRMRGNFLIKELKYLGDFSGERNYRLSMQSSGEVVAL
jgi:predicted secreted protein